ncbi:GIY-YIG nuclease family protein [Spirosoma utsteinense]|uniref:GIY-YIG domain-containing protein n=1 Tax=Spirosoma utsteinense TaxID=2585773 RepID=A0ABR6WCQ0_9BACT|nr:GIY-YIG nuclease family protein [Spirosoma utsteinense]MBC3788391.1 hypothetical protein [Spirosoma utsteinense]MBC3794345.1 hypothetical protein [Spirosoma utsteinense]
MEIAKRTVKKHVDLGQILVSGPLLLPQPCIYYLIDAEDKVVFVGQTLNLQSRLLEHRIAGLTFVRFRFFTCDVADLDRLEQEAMARCHPGLSKARPCEVPLSKSTSGLLSKQLICLKHNITPLAFDRLREAFGLQPAGSFGQARFYKPGDVDAWLRRFKELVVSGRHVLQAKPTYLAVGISSRTRQIQLFTK